MNGTDAAVEPHGLAAASILESCVQQSWPLVVASRSQQVPTLEHATTATSATSAANR